MWYDSLLTLLLAVGLVKGIFLAQPNYGSSTPANNFVQRIIGPTQSTFTVDGPTLTSAGAQYTVTVPNYSRNIFQDYSDRTARLPVVGFGVSNPPTLSSEEPPGYAASTRFSNPPPPEGYAQDPATSTCGLPPQFCSRSRYRSIDGSCNNLQRPVWGMPNTPYGRLIPPKYGDSVGTFARSVSGRELPNPRVISLLLFPDRQLVDPVWNLNAQQWGQIITHDMSLLAGVPQSHRNPVVCCNDAGWYTADVHTNSQCAPIPVPEDDPVHSPYHVQCMNFVRTTNTRNRRCVSGSTPADPLTTVTGYMDLSNVYGNGGTQSSAIRLRSGGRLLTEVRNGREWLPREPNITIVCEMAQALSEPCYLAGDIRVNQNPQLTILQIILHREHNRIADNLAALNPHWDDETIFQEARRINAAQVQNINYYEWLPIFLGVDNMIKNKLIYPGAHEYINDYDPSVDPTVLNEHANAAFRHFHTLIRGYLHLVSERRRSFGAVRISDWFNRPAILENGDSFDQLTRGLVTQSMDFSDQFWDSEITQFLFKRNNTFGGDLRATDIQRGRDTGLGSYITQRAACGLSVPKSFDDLGDYISAENIKVLSSLYEYVEDIDLVVGGSLERNVRGAQAGPTFLCILTEQFYRTRVGDRYFFENGGDRDIAFTPHQLNEIRKSSIARILCDNADKIGSMQPRAFQQINSHNPLMPCSDLPSIDLTLWRDASVPTQHYSFHK